MSPVPYAGPAGQAPAFDVSNPRAVFVWITEARETMDELACVAADVLRPRRRRHLTRRVAVARYRRARAAMAWLDSMTLDAPGDPAKGQPVVTGAPFEAWAE